VMSEEGIPGPNLSDLRVSMALFPSLAAGIR